jgi:hypothetical protein
MQRVVKFDRRAWSLLRKATKKSRDSGEFYSFFYTFILRRAGMTHAETAFFKNLGKKINPRAFKVTKKFDSQLMTLHRRMCRGADFWSSANWGPSTVIAPSSASTDPTLRDDEILIQDDYYI